jgi:hypothetical protein
MASLRKILGILVFVAFALMAGSVVCLVTAQASVMGGCGGGMGAAAMCPFMSASVPAVTSATATMKTLGLVLALFFAVGFAIKTSALNIYNGKIFAFARQRKGDLPIGQRSNVVLNLISEGVLHSRVFDF